MGDDYSSGEEFDDYYSDGDSDGAVDDESGKGDCNISSSARSSTQVITRESLLAAQREDLRRVMELLPLTEQHARTLLIHHRWDVDRILAVLVENGRDRLFLEAGVTVLESRDVDLSMSSNLITCNICFEDIIPTAVTKMECGHCYCNDCWTEHFIVKINDGQSRRIRCMAPKCNSICDEAIVRKLVSTKHPDIADRFERFLLESYIEDNNKVKWCPSIPHCGNAIRIEGDIYCEVECTCGLQFCFSCLSEAHSPCSCLMWELWTKKCRDESETVNWITANTKSCPKCYKHVEKNGGCNLVTCICGQSFCWLCGGSTGREHTWSSIAGHSCGRYVEEEKKAERAKRELYRYMHYHKFYKGHTDSLKEESKLEATIQDKISILESRKTSMKDYSWVLNGLSRLSRARRVLSYSYPFAFYMFGDDIFKDEMTKEQRDLKRHLFEAQQQQFEFYVERLSKCLMEPFDGFSDKELSATRMDIINLSVLVNHLCQKMYECIENDLLGSLQNTIHNIAPYKSNGIERASELTVSWNSDSSIRSMKSTTDDSHVHATRTSTGASEPGRSSCGRLLPGPSGLDDSGCSTRKRARKEVRGDGFFDLNLPADMTEKRLEI